LVLCASPLKEKQKHPQRDKKQKVVDYFHLLHTIEQLWKKDHDMAHLLNYSNTVL
jgi:plasmid rolling circle replication initiator protein Rep